MSKKRENRYPNAEVMADWELELLAADETPSSQMIDKIDKADKARDAATVADALATASGAAWDKYVAGLPGDDKRIVMRARLVLATVPAAALPAAIRAMFGDAAVVAFRQPPTPEEE